MKQRIRVAVTGIVGYGVLLTAFLLSFFHAPHLGANMDDYWDLFVVVFLMYTPILAGGVFVIINTLYAIGLLMGRTERTKRICITIMILYAGYVGVMFVVFYLIRSKLFHLVSVCDLNSESFTTSLLTILPFIYVFLVRTDTTHQFVRAAQKNNIKE